MLDFRMYTFITLSETLNYTKAAQQLCITQPAVTQHIKHLENYYHVPLFTHAHKQLQLTPQGKILQKHIMRIAADEAKLNELLTMNTTQPHHFRFGATRTIGEFILPQKLPNYLSTHPETTLSMIVENTSTLLQMLKDGQIDFAFIEGYFKKSDFTYHLLFKEPFIAVKGKDYQLNKQVQRLEDLLNETLILREAGSGTREILERVLDEQNLQPHDFKKLIEIGNIHAIKQLVLQNQGITFLYEAAIKEELEKKTLEQIPLTDFQITREFNFICLKDSIFTETYEAFFNYIKSE